MSHLYYGDNLDVLRKYIRDESVDLCYIDPPFNSKRNYNQIYNNVGKEDLAQAQAFIDTWDWDALAIKGFDEITGNNRGLFTRQTINLIVGLQTVLGDSSLLAYLISMTLRIGEIHRVLKSTGSFYLHCDSTSSHYLKLVLDSIFCSQGGCYQNQIIWKRTTAHNDAGRWGRVHDVIFFYTKSEVHRWNTTHQAFEKGYLEAKYRYQDEKGQYRLDNLTAPAHGDNGRFNWHGFNPPNNRMWRYSLENLEKLEASGSIYWTPKGRGGKPGFPQLKHYLKKSCEGSSIQDFVADIPPINSQAKERLGYPTQKPEMLLERIIKASSSEGDVILDAYCGCGTTVAVAQKLNRAWIGIDITYQSISLILKRLEDSYGSKVLETIKLTGIPKDLESAEELANNDKDDRVRKEFEKWALLAYSKNRAAINQKKGADQGVDGWGFFPITDKEFGRIVFQVKSGKVGAKDVRELLGTVTREKAELGILITLKKPTKEMLKEAKTYGMYHFDLMHQDVPKVQIVTVQEMLEESAYLNLPLVASVLKSSPRHVDGEQMNLLAG